MGEELKQTIKKVLVDSKSILSYRGIDIKGNKAVKVLVLVEGQSLAFPS